MLIRMADWEKIRKKFSDDEKADINAVITGQSICPRAIIIDENALKIELKVKLTNALKSIPGNPGVS